MSVRSARDVYLAENGFSTAAYDEPTATVTFWGRDYTVPNPPSRQLAVRFHDLHHVMTGYGTDPAGEFEMSAWEVRRGMRVFGAYVQLIIGSGALFGLLVFPVRTLAAWRAAKSPMRLPAPSLSIYEELLALSLGELRARYGLPAEGIAGARALHERAPRQARVLARTGP
ncbi:MAG: hypothetical protein ACO3JL_14770 [Myxococcota bacterium]